MKTQTLTSLRGFTLIELMLSTALIALLMLLFVTMVEQTSNIWKRTTSKISQFQSTRAAFDAMTRNLSQATLNTYWQPDPPRPIATSGTAGKDIANWSPTDYVRASDLHFVCGPALRSDLVAGKEDVNPTHSVFFQAPLGATSLPETASSKLLKFDRLDNFLSAVGYYVEWGADSTRPAFLDSMTPKMPQRYRFRLMQVRQEGEDMAIYAMKDAGNFKLTDWIKAARGLTVGTWTKPTNALEPRVMAENIVALIIMPKTVDTGTPSASAGSDLAPEYRYDSRPSTNGTAQLTWQQLKTGSYATERQWYNQLPPVVTVTMVAIDELSAQRFNDPTAPSWTVGKFTKTNKLESDLNDVETTLRAARVNYRIFSTDVVIRGSKWTRPEK